MQEKYCQSCAMPMSPEDYSTNADGSENQSYCKYCYENGAFTSDDTMEEMIEACIPHMVPPNGSMTPEMARKILEESLPQLERWKKQ